VKGGPFSGQAEGALVEAAGQLFHLFRDGLDYAFILKPLAQIQERGVLSGRDLRAAPES
jgi:hypothetical protein